MKCKCRLLNYFPLLNNEIATSRFPRTNHSSGFAKDDTSLPFRPARAGTDGGWVYILHKIIRYFLIKMCSVFTQHIVLMTGIDHIINLYIFINGGSNKSNRMLLHNNRILEAMYQQKFSF